MRPDHATKSTVLLETELISRIRSNQNRLASRENVLLD
jgi:hypothetical protein